MPVTIDSTRFGVIEIADESVIEFPHGLIGLGGTRYALVAKEEDSAFVWLHSLDDPSLALAVTNPFQFFPTYEVVLSDGEVGRIGIDDSEDADVFVTVRTAPELENFRCNLRAPILVSSGKGYQVINEADEAPVRAPLFEALATADAA
ncbi:MAG: flagellar assembly factor FliW [Thermoleophilaceae bacterium]|jgi:flagellar assembly factor FliW|nr:flagellar assembly factor FliW [Thermoleophilaceae bacterium]